MKTVEVNIGDIRENPNNPRLIKDDKFKKLVQSIKDFPQMLAIRPIVVNADMTVLGGNMRLKACKEAGLEKVPVIMANDLTEEQQKEFIIKDNVGFGDWDWDMIANEWDSQQVTDWGLDIPDFKVEADATEDDYEIPDEIQTNIVIGDLFEIGHHRLLCGDSTDSDNVAKLMNGEKADMGFNDPPYGMKKESEGVLNDNLNYNDLLQFNKEWIALQFSHIKENGSFYCWGTDEPLMDIYSEIIKPYIKEQKATFRNLITWDKGNGQGQNSEEYRMYPIADEKCLFIMCGAQDMKHKRNLEEFNEMFEPIRKWFEQERKKSGLSVAQISEIDSTRCSHYWAKVQFEFPTKEAFCKIQNYCQQNNINAFKKEYDELKKEYDELKKEYYSTRAYFDNIHDNQNNVWHFDRTSHKERETTGGHATPKPIQLCERAIKSSCPEIGLVIDFFLGSGSTMVASHQLNRKCYGMELDCKYCEVIVQRMVKLDKTLTIKRNGVDETQKWLDKA